MKDFTKIWVCREATNSNHIYYNYDWFGKWLISK